MFELKPTDFMDNGQKLTSKFASKPTIVKFYLPKCIWCIRSQGDFVKLDKMASADFNVAQMDASKYPSFIDTLNGSNIFGFQVQGFPTYAIFVRGEFRTLYKGDRTTANMINSLIHVA